jgi:ribosomal protein S18 acetylase RimI-like enzyme
MEIRKEHISKEKLVEYFRSNRELFNPPLESRVVIEEYSDKLSRSATLFSAYLKGEMIGLLACYFNDNDRGTGFISTFSVKPENQKTGIGRQLVEKCIEYGRKKQFRQINFEIFNNNINAIEFFKKIEAQMVQKKNDVSLFTLLI